MLDVNQIHHDWVAHPTGTIPPGEWCAECKRYNVRNSTVTTLGICEGEILLIQRNQNPEAGAWASPGGYIGWNETLAEAAIREFYEESGIKLDAVTFLGLYDKPARDKDGRQNIDHCFVAEVPKDAVFNHDPNEVRNIQWFSLENLPDNIAFDHRDMINDYLKGKK